MPQPALHKCTGLAFEKRAKLSQEYIFLYNGSMNECPVSCAICAYKESPYLEECIKSLCNQTVVPHIFIATSTPNSFITSLASKYKIPVYTRSGASNLVDDWNFAYEQAKTPYVTICHQDDIYEPTYVEEILKSISKDTKNEIILLHTRWKMLKKGTKTYSRCAWVHLMLNSIAGFFPSSRWVRLRALSLGSVIKTPSVCYNKNRCPSPLFDSKYSFALDWENAVKLAKLSGKFIYINRPVFSYRVSSQALSFMFTHNTVRTQEDLQMFRSLWPAPIAKMIAYVYRLAYSVYD